MGGDPVQVRVTMGKEPTSFLQLFEGKMIVHQGGVVSGFKNRNDEDSFDTDGISLFHVRGSNSLNTRAVQVEEVAGSLNSGDCFVLLTPEKMIVWQGKGSNDQEKATSENIAKVMQGNRGVDVVAEGDEPDLFWDSIGGKGEYSQAKEYGELEADPRLFQMSCDIGHFNVEEIYNYDQSDLCMDDVMMLDVVSEVFLWVGPEARREEKDNAMAAALEYVKNAPDGRDPDTPVYRISAGFEPPQFTQHFLGWDIAKSNAAGEDPYLAELRARGIDVSGGGMVAVSADQVGFAKFVDQGGEPKTLAELQAGTPAGCDPAAKEEYLSAEDFQATFGMARDAFRGLAKWKKQAAKKKAKLF
jgi:villin 1/advillin